MFIKNVKIEGQINQYFSFRVCATELKCIASDLKSIASRDLQRVAAVFQNPTEKKIRVVTFVVQVSVFLMSLVSWSVMCCQDVRFMDRQRRIARRVS